MTETKSRAALELEVRALKRSQRALRGQLTSVQAVLAMTRAIVGGLEEQRGGLLTQLADSQEGLGIASVLVTKITIENTMLRKHLTERKFPPLPSLEVSSQHSEAVQYSYMRPFVAER